MEAEDKAVRGDRFGGNRCAALRLGDGDERAQAIVVGSAETGTTDVKGPSAGAKLGKGTNNGERPSSLAEWSGGRWRREKGGHGA